MLWIIKKNFRYKEMGIIIKIRVWIMDIQLLMNFPVKTSLFIQNTFLLVIPSIQ